MPLLRNLFSDIGTVLRVLAALPAALLPHRRWGHLHGLPIERLAFFSALTTVAVGVAIGVHGFFEFAQAASDALAQATLGHWMKLAPTAKPGETASALPTMAASGLSSFAFLLATPTGWLADYLVLSGFVRAMASWFDDPVGDPILTGLDHLQERLRGGARTSHVRRSREREEGPEVPDQLFTGAWAGRPEVDFVVVASRRKPDWTKGTFVITSDKWYTLGEPFDMRLPQGLRAVYPLTEQKVCEVLRRGVRYELPPLRKSPPRRARRE
jgi:hypothetical protein